MNIDETPRQAELRAQIRAALEGIDGRCGPAPFEVRVEVDRRLGAAGLLGATWPKDYGRGLSATDALVLEDELAKAGFPLTRQPSRFAVNMLGPAIIRHGTPEQKATLLPSIRRAEHIWCQGFSEPDAGSDLAGVRTTAVDDGGGLRLNGGKIWTTQAQYADYCFVLARTEHTGNRYQDLSLLLVNMKQSGVQVSPITQATGAQEFNEVRFTDVLVDPSAIVGRRGEGWRVAMTALSSERTYGLLSRFHDFGGEFRQLRDLVSATDPGSLAQLGTVAARLTAIRALAYRAASHHDSGEPDKAAGLAPVIKLWWSETHQAMADLGWSFEARAAAGPMDWFFRAIDSRSDSIVAGTNDIQRNLLAERWLGLPRNR